MEAKTEMKEKLRTQPLPSWVQSMQREYSKTGAYNAKYLRKLLGNPTVRVEVGPNVCVASNLRES